MIAVLLALLIILALGTVVWHPIWFLLLVLLVVVIFSPGARRW